MMCQGYFFRRHFRIFYTGQKSFVRLIKSEKNICEKSLKFNLIAMKIPRKFLIFPVNFNIGSNRK